MTPAARVQTAIELLDAISAGQPAEQALTRWARANRYAGSKDRAAVRDHVFDVLRMWRSTAALGGGETGRARMLGLLRAQGVDPEGVFTGLGHGPAALDAAERQAGRAPGPAEARDLPDWLWPRFLDGQAPAQAEADLQALRQRAPVDLRVNLSKTTLLDAMARLAEDGIDAAPVALCDTALRVRDGARRVSQSAAFSEGWVELQDAASQAVVADLPLNPGDRVLDYCAGGGGKTLAVAARTRAEVWAHDANPQRMRDLPTRAARAGAKITQVTKPRGTFDLVLCDVPCSGSGSWRRAPEGKWRLTQDRLAKVQTEQAQILQTAATHVRPGGVLAYATCSLLDCENSVQIQRFLALFQEFSEQFSRGYRLTDGGDGFFISILTKRV